MKKTTGILALLALFMLPLAASAQLRVFACEPEWSALAEAIGGDLVEAGSATHALQDPHYVEARPSLIAQVRKADLLICSGAQLEIGWLSMLLSKANNARVLPGKDGFLEASTLVRRLDVPDSVDRAQGDMHPQGNPHIQMNPHNIARVAGALGQRMAALDPANASGYAAGTADFLRRWEAAIATWEERARPLAGKRVISHHKSWVYLEDWLGLVEVGTLEPVPGIPPTAAHLSSLLAELGADGQGTNKPGAEFIIRAPFHSAKASEWLQERTGIPALALPMTIGGSERAKDLFSWFDDVIDSLLAARSEPRP
ncbi:MAG: zinc ABC transporter substrate-binding protein [Lysobacterales bacterium]|nr:MAG: zinc ABC transporter substrate-binding protein [Xanthomonadales bacterium]